MYLPEEYKNDTHQTFPLMLYLHGGGESGQPIEKLQSGFLPTRMEQNQVSPFIILSPLHPEKLKFWDERKIMLLLDTIQKTYRVDNNRVYLVGVSRGAYGAWRTAIQYPNRFAALVTVCGVAPSPYAKWLKDMPVWVFHNQGDDAIPVEESDAMVKALRNNNNPVKYTRYKKEGHDAWTETFNNSELYNWILEQCR